MLVFRLVDRSEKTVYRKKDENMLCAGGGRGEGGGRGREREGY